MKRIILILSFFFAVTLIHSDGLRYEMVDLSAEGQGLFEIQYQSNGRTYFQWVYNSWRTVIRSQPGNIITLAAKANSNPVDIAIEDQGLTIIEYHFGILTHNTQ